MTRVIITGVHSHEIVDKEMRRLQKLRISGDIDDTIILVEHPEVLTVGPRSRKENTPIPEGYDSVPVDRGGGITWHGPGQVICYPIIEWKRDGEENVAKIINILENWIIAALQKMEIDANRDPRMQGVWIGNNKVASIGLSFLHWTSRHGFTINYDTPAGRVEYISGCGLGSEVTTSLKTLGHSVTKEVIHESLIETLNIIGRPVTEVSEMGSPPWT